MALPTYSSRNVKASWGGTDFEGFMPDSFISFSRNTDITDEEVGADSQLSISIVPDRSGTCTMSFQKMSPTNIALSALLNSQEAEGGIYIADISIVDPAGSAVAQLTNAHIKTAPEVSFGSSATGVSYDWVFYCEKMNFLSTPAGIIDGDNADIVARAAAAVGTLADKFFDA